MCVRHVYNKNKANHINFAQSNVRKGEKLHYFKFSTTCSKLVACRIELNSGKEGRAGRVFLFLCCGNG